MVDGEAEPVTDVLTDEGAVDGDGQGVLGVLRITECVDTGGARDPLAYGAECLLERIAHGLVARSGRQERQRPLDGAVDGLAAGQPVDDHREGAGREIRRGVAVGLRRALHGELADQLGFPAHEQSEGRGADERAGVAGGGVLGLVDGAEDLVGQAGQTGARRVAPGVEPFLAGEPAVVLAALVGPPVPLGGRPAQMGPVDVGRRVPGTGVAADLGAYEAVDREEGQLGGGGDGAAAAVGGDEVGDPVRAVGGTYLVQRQRGDPGAQRVADGPAQQTAAHPGAEVLLLGTSPDGCGSCGHAAPSLLVRSTVIDRERSLHGRNPAATAYEAECDGHLRAGSDHRPRGVPAGRWIVPAGRWAARAVASRMPWWARAVADTVAARSWP